MVCHGKGQASVLGPAGKLPQDENKTKRAHHDGGSLFLCDSCHKFLSVWVFFHELIFVHYILFIDQFLSFFTDLHVLFMP